MPHLDHLFASIAKGDLNKLISLLKKNPQCVNAAEELCYHSYLFNFPMESKPPSKHALSDNIRESITLLHYAVIQDRPEIVIYLSNTPDCVLAPQEKNYGHSPLHLACFHGNHRMAQHLLTKLNSDEINLQDKFGWTSLHHAVRNGHLELCMTLLKSKAKPTLMNNLGKTPLHYATQYGYLDILKELYDLVPPATITPSPTEHFSLPVLTLFHLSALNNHDSIINWLQLQRYPPNVKCQRATHQNGENPLEELAEDTALARGYPTLRNIIHAYRQQYEMWIQDIASDHAHLGHVKLSLCGPPDGGKTCLKEALERSHFQLLLGGDSESESNKKITYGIDANTTLQIGHDLYHVWDFSGNISYYSTHHFFLSTNHTIYGLVIDLSRPLPEIRHELFRWISLIKMHNIGSLSSYHHREALDIIKLQPKINPKVILPNQQRSRTISVPTVSRFRSRFSSMSTTLKPPKVSRSISPSDPPPTSSEDFLGLITSPISSSTTPPLLSSTSSSISPAFALIIGSHVDLLPESERSEKIRQVEGFLQEMAGRFHPHIEVSSQVVTVNCCKPSPSDIKSFKEQIGYLRGTQMESENTYPKVFDKIIKKIEAIKAQQETKVLSFDEFCSMVHSGVNRLLSEQQISYILKSLSNTGVVTYIEHGALSQWVFIDNHWLCHDILGVAQAPPTDSSPLREYKSHTLTEEQITSSFPSCANHFYCSFVMELLQHFEVCSKVRGSNPTCYHFPTLFDSDSATTDEIWSKGRVSFPTHIGRRLLVTDETEYFPPGFFLRLQAQLVSLTTPSQSVHFNMRSVIIDSAHFQVCIQISLDDLSINLIGRISDKDDSVNDSSDFSQRASNCLQLIDHVQSQLVKVVRSVCPSVFLQWGFLSAKELGICIETDKESDEIILTANRHVFTTNEIVQGLKTETSIWNESLKCFESIQELLFFNCPDLMETYTGRGSYLILIHDEIFEKLEDLLNDEDDELPGWKLLAKQLNLTEYTELLLDKENPVKRLILKWGEKPRWTVDSLLYALQEIGRKDAYNLVRAKMDKKYKV